MIRRSITKEEITQKALSLEDCLAKTLGEKNGEKVSGVNVEEHCKIVGLVAQELIRIFPTEFQSDFFPEGTELIAAVHDVGKVSPIFQEKIRRSLKNYSKNSLPGLEHAQPDIESIVGYHWAVSQAALYNQGKYIAEIAGCHHGVSPINVPLSDQETIGGIEWQARRSELIKKMKVFFNREWPIVRDDIHFGLLSGLTTVADWIGSGSSFDHIQGISDKELKEKVKKAVKEAGFVNPQIKKGLKFEDVFNSYKPRAIQTQLIEMADKPGVYIVEALMGQGKTEAALQAAYHFLETGQSRGIYFALPTQLTSEKIQDRMKLFLKNILVPEERHHSLLLHSNAWMVENSLNNDNKPDYSWFYNKKRGILAPFAVGTIDQALMAVMNVKHGFVRTFGLAGKVVILDEVHTYDSYTGTIMDNLIQSLSCLGCIVILLSATLTKDRKKKFMGSKISEALFNELKLEQYPLITKVVKNEKLQFSERIDSDAHNFSVQFTEDDEISYEIAKTRSSEGDYVLWIENTITEAQQVYKRMAAWGYENSIEVGLIHSRFPHCVRNNREDYWVSLFGKSGKTERTKSGKILIGTQVLEQSLDIDADFLITRLAPTDMILQRLGRVWRHKELNSYRASGANRQVIILAPKEEKALINPLWSFGSTGMVYAPYVLARTLEVWKQHKVVTIPDDMRELIEETYRDRVESGGMAQARADLSTKKETLQRFANITMSNIIKTASERMSTRYSEIPSCDVLLIRKEPDLKSLKVEFFDGSCIDLPSKPDFSQRKQITKLLMSHLISVSVHLAPKALSSKELSWLFPYLYLPHSKEEESPLRVALIDPSGSLRSLRGCDVNEKYNLSYSNVLGYVASKK